MTAARWAATLVLLTGNALPAQQPPPFLDEEAARAYLRALRAEVVAPPVAGADVASVAAASGALTSLAAEVRTTRDRALQTAKRVESAAAALAGRLDLIELIGPNPCKEAEEREQKLKDIQATLAPHIAAFSAALQRGQAASGACRSKSDVDRIRLEARNASASYRAFKKAIEPVRPLALDLQGASRLRERIDDLERDAADAQTLSDSIVRLDMEHRAMARTYESLRSSIRTRMRRVSDGNKSFDVAAEIRSIERALQDQAKPLEHVSTDPEGIERTLSQDRADSRAAQEAQLRIKAIVARARAFFVCPVSMSVTDPSRSAAFQEIFNLDMAMGDKVMAPEELTRSADECEKRLTSAPSILGSSSTKVDPTKVKAEGKGVDLGAPPPTPPVTPPPAAGPPSGPPAASNPTPGGSSTSNAPPPAPPEEGTFDWSGGWEMKGTVSATMTLSLLDAAGGQAELQKNYAGSVLNICRAYGSRPMRVYRGTIAFINGGTGPVVACTTGRELNGRYGSQVDASPVGQFTFTEGRTYATWGEMRFVMGSNEWQIKKR